MQLNQVIHDDSLNVMKKMGENSVDMIYLDPPFYTQNEQKLSSARTGEEYAFSDKWTDMDEYLSYMAVRLKECKRILKHTGSIFVHCDRNASHYLKITLDKIFGSDHFQSEIIWFYKRWSNSKKGLLNNHQTILFYSKTGNYKFNSIYTDYSDTTNIDQILQERVRDKNGKTTYKTDESGNIVVGPSKKGVPLSDVWEIPFLNPKAKERVGYPTQKPIILLEQVIKLVTDKGDVVMDPFAGSGTTLVAAKMLGRKYIGVDISADAVKLADARLHDLVKTESILLQKGKAAYRNLSDEQMGVLKSIGAIAVQRNSGIDGFLKEYIDGKPISVRIQREDETLNDSISRLIKASKAKKCAYMVLIRTHSDLFDLYDFKNIPENLEIIDSYEMRMSEMLDKLNAEIQKSQRMIL